MAGGGGAGRGWCPSAAAAGAVAGLDDGAGWVSTAGHALLGVTESLARATGWQLGEAQTVQRVQEYVVEPPVLQQLPETAFLLVELQREQGGRRLKEGD